MADYYNRIPANRDRRADPHKAIVRLDGGIEAARMLR
jgi:hypothetical protein